MVTFRPFVSGVGHSIGEFCLSLTRSRLVQPVWFVHVSNLIRFSSVVPIFLFSSFTVCTQSQIVFWREFHYTILRDRRRRPHEIVRFDGDEFA